jgi:hypothetical protein
MDLVTLKGGFYVLKSLFCMFYPNYIGRALLIFLSELRTFSYEILYNAGLEAGLFWSSAPFCSVPLSHNERALSEYRKALSGSRLCISPFPSSALSMK